MAGNNLGLAYQPGPGDSSYGGFELITTDDVLTSAVWVSLFTWRRANDDDWLPAEDGNRMGWWADSDLGSRLWLLQRAKAVPSTALRAKEYAGEALRWLLDQKIATEIQIESAIDGDRLLLGIQIYRDKTQVLDLKFQNLWDAMTAAYPQ